MRHQELKRFTFRNPPTGLEIADLVREHELYGWTMDIERKDVPPSYSMQMALHNWIYEVTFEKGVEK